MSPPRLINSGAKHDCLFGTSPLTDDQFGMAQTSDYLLQQTDLLLMMRSQVCADASYMERLIQRMELVYDQTGLGVCHANQLFIVD